MLPIVNVASISIAPDGRVQIDGSQLNSFLASITSYGTNQPGANSSGCSNRAGCANDGCGGDNIGCANIGCT
jgi:hypothetical protein